MLVNLLRTAMPEATELDKALNDKFISKAFAWICLERCQVMPKHVIVLLSADPLGTPGVWKSYILLSEKPALERP